jgi:hypothetical protein
MNIVVPAIVGLVLLAGLLTLAFGHKGWSWGTVAAAILALLASGGYVYLAARIAERERAWTKVVRKYEVDLLRERDATTLMAQGEPQPIPEEKSLVALADEEARWRRVLERVETWRGRAWQQATFAPPQADAPGTITLPEQEAPAAVEDEPAAAPDAADGAAPEGAAAEGADAEGAKPAAGGGPALPINAGAQVSVFDDASLEEGGRFLGVFRVVGAAYDPAAKRTTLQIVPAMPPDATDRRAWSKTYESVTVYEDLPVDRWMAFHRMPSQASGSDAAGVLPPPAKRDAKDLLAKLERLEAEFERHGTEVEGEPEEIVAQIAAGTAVPGRYWAEVEFTTDHDLDEAVVKRITELLAPDIEDEDMVKKTFATGDIAEFDLQTARDLGDKVKILKVIDRRPLADAFTALLGGAIPGGAGGMRADGIAALRRTLEGEIAALEQATMRLASTQQNVTGQQSRFDDERRDLQDDLGQWKIDVAAAEQTAGAFDQRLKRLAGELAATMKAIGTLGQELTAGMDRLTAEIDRRTPPPVRGGSLPQAVPTR